jgi:hypothetical protein
MFHVNSMLESDRFKFSVLFNFMPYLLTLNFSTILLNFPYNNKNSGNSLSWSDLKLGCAETILDKCSKLITGFLKATPQGTSGSEDLWERTDMRERQTLSRAQVTSKEYSEDSQGLHGQRILGFKALGFVPDQLISRG